MILNAVVRFLKTVLGFLVKALAWLLFVFGLWLPCLYLVVFLLVCAFTQTPLNTVLSTLIAGLVFSFIAGLVISYYIDKSKRKKKQVVKRKRNEPSPTRVPVKEKDEKNDFGAKKRDFAEREYPGARDDSPRYESDYEPEARFDATRDIAESYDEDIFSPKEGFEPQGGDVRRESYGRAYGPAPEPERRKADFDTPKDNGLLDKKSDKPVYDFATEAKLQNKYFESIEKSRLEERKEYDYEAGARKRLDNIMSAPSDEAPLIFRSRADRDIYICEYSDRLEYYLRTAGGEMRLLDVRYRRRDY